MQPKFTKSISNKENCGSVASKGANNTKAKVVNKNNVSMIVGVKGNKSGAKLQKDIDFLKSKMKEHFKFFANHSPELKKKRKIGSHSPPLK